MTVYEIESHDSSVFYTKNFRLAERCSGKPTVKVIRMRNMSKAEYEAIPEDKILREGEI